MRDVLDPLEFGGHLFFLLLVLLILLALVNAVLLEFVFDLVYFLVEEAADVRLLFDQYLRGFVLDGADVVDDLVVQFVDLFHAVAVVVVQAAFGSVWGGGYFSYSCSYSMIPRYWIYR
jgi:hypothetical protein